LAGPSWWCWRAALIAPGGRAGLLVVAGPVGVSGGGGNGSDAREGGLEVALPGPARGQVQCPAACVAGQAAGEGQQRPADGARGAHDGAGEAEQFGPAQQVVGERGEHGPGAVGVEVPGGEVRRRLVVEVGDDLLDDGVIAVLGLDERDVFGAVGDEGEVAPVGP
jgi:hypothetical protein